MIDDPFEWLAVALDDDEPTIPDAFGHGWWHRVANDEETRPVLALDDSSDYTIDLAVE